MPAHTLVDLFRSRDAVQSEIMSAGRAGRSTTRHRVVHPDGTYDWRRDGCRAVRRRYGPRRRLCRKCQNVWAYAGKVPLGRRRCFTLESAQYARVTGQAYRIRAEHGPADP
ncbi:MAG: hypothetical protein OXN89_13735 [Bryobacterales bacterium]|nr:hypothetical protein [Bryobacterales bacterium]